MKIARLFSVIATSALLASSAMVLTAASHAATLGHADVPFAFQAGASTLPAGTYKIQNMYSGGGLVLINSSGESVAILTTPLGNPNKVEVSPHLLFKRAGSSYYLSEVWLFHSNMGARVSMSKEQQALIAKSATQEDRVELALVRD
jgi:hypothetical protein